MPIPICRKSGRVLSIENVPDGATDARRILVSARSRGDINHAHNAVREKHDSQIQSMNDKSKFITCQKSTRVCSFPKRPENPARILIDFSVSSSSSKGSNKNQDQSRKRSADDNTALMTSTHSTGAVGPTHLKDSTTETRELDEKISKCAKKDATLSHEKPEAPKEYKDNRCRNGKKYRVKDVDPVKTLSFPAKLHAILSQKMYKDIISWMPHGRSWRVHKPKAFEKHVVPHFFVQCKYSSFIRQANGWGFRRIMRGRDRNSYYHPYFLRGRLSLCQKMFRPGTFKKPGIDPENEPDFYQLSELDPLPEVDVVEPHHLIKEALNMQKKYDEMYTKDPSKASHQNKDSNQAELVASNHRVFDLQEQQNQKAFSDAKHAIEQSTDGIFEKLSGNSDPQKKSPMLTCSSTNNKGKWYDEMKEKTASTPEETKKPNRLQELLEISQHFRSRRGEFETS